MRERTLSVRPRTSTRVFDQHHPPATADGTDRHPQTTPTLGKQLGLKRSEDLVVDAAEAAVGHDGDNVTLAQFGHDVCDDFVSAR